MIRKLLSPFLTSLFLLAHLSAQPLKVGSDIPSVEGVNQNNETVNFSSFAEEEWLLVFFYPKAHTGGCTKQVCALRDAYEQLTEKGVKVVGVSSDNVKSQKSFSDKHKLPYSLVADKEGKVIDAFGVPVIKVGLASRQAYLFKKGKLVWRDLKASTKQQATDVLKQIK